ncbi:hypothetical protein T07_14875 [Trichinella nelsoni]|uniref:Uncharacterized protein n=1 Tax=Trichinella nelsoni TaxID=6336 RepID=A0A0V0RDW6_9BILA|nr:hypothetical protein T07_14875 [Trichinella nelsoni]
MKPQENLDPCCSVGNTIVSAVRTLPVAFSHPQTGEVYKNKKEAEQLEITFIYEHYKCEKHCSERNNTDLVGVTWPRAGAQKPRVGQEQYPRTAGQIAIWASGGTKLGGREALCCAPIDRRSQHNGEGLDRRRRWRAPPGDRAAYWWFAWVDPEATDPGSIYRARKRAASQLYNRCTRGRVGCEKDELEVLDESSRSACIRTIERRVHPNRSGGIRLTVRDERYNAGSRTFRARSPWRIMVAESVNRKTSTKEIAVYEGWYPDHSPRRGRLHPMHSFFVQST